MKKLFVVVALLAVMLVASPVIAKEGFYLGGFIPFNKITGDSTNVVSNTYINSLDTGAGLGLRLGYGFNRYFSIEGSFFGSSHKSNLDIVNQNFSGTTLDAKVNFPLTGHSFDPYVLLGVGRYTLGDSLGKYKGSGSQFGVGIDLYLVPELSLNTGLTWRRITFGSNDSGFTGDLNARVTTFDVGLTYHFI